MTIFSAPLRWEENQGDEVCQETSAMGALGQDATFFHIGKSVSNGAVLSLTPTVLLTREGAAPFLSHGLESCHCKR
jgi:hypothetical protein